MPTYRFRNNETGEEFDDFINNSRREELLKKILTYLKYQCFGIVSTTGTIDGKTDDGWKEVLNKVTDAHPDSPLADRYAKKSIKDVKTKQVVEKHRHKWRNN